MLPLLTGLIPVFNPSSRLALLVSLSVDVSVSVESLESVVVVELSSVLCDSSVAVGIPIILLMSFFFSRSCFFLSCCSHFPITLLLNFLNPSIMSPSTSSFLGFGTNFSLILLTMLRACSSRWPWV